MWVNSASKSSTIQEKHRVSDLYVCVFLGLFRYRIRSLYSPPKIPPKPPTDSAPPENIPTE